MPLMFSSRHSKVQQLLSQGVAAGLALSLPGCGGTTSTLSGAGASFPAPIYQRWFQELANQGVRVNYQSVGSGAGVRQAGESARSSFKANKPGGTAGFQGFPHRLTSHRTGALQ